MASRIAAVFGLTATTTAAVVEWLMASLSDVTVWCALGGFTITLIAELPRLAHGLQFLAELRANGWRCRPASTPRPAAPAAPAAPSPATVAALARLDDVIARTAAMHDELAGNAPRKEQS